MPPNYIEGETKRCNGPLCNGNYIPLKQFWVHKRGKRAGKLFSQCIDCENFNKWGNTEPHGHVVYNDVRFIFEELVNRVGKAETARRIGISGSFFCRHKRSYIHVRKATVAKAMVELKKAREKNEARHKKSIRHGSAMRGHAERVPTHRHDFNGKDALSEFYKNSYLARKLTAQ